MGDKLSGDIYDSQDIKLLEILSSELALAISNAKAYEEIGQFTATLQKRVHEATAELKDANEDLTALDKSKDEFISMASHQLRTPLTAIKGYLSMLIEGDAGNVRGEQKEFLEYAYDGTERMVGLIADLLNVSRLSAGRFVVDDQPTDLASIVASEVTRLRSHAESKHLNLHLVPLHGQLPKIEVDSDKTRQVVVNFIENAIYYTNKGSIYVSADCDDERLYFRVRDTGIGVPKAAQKRLFKKFYRAKNAQAVRADGTGLGLYLAQKVIESEGGTIIFESAEGKGSTFGFTLPLKHHVPAKAPDKPKIINVKATA